MMTIFAIIGILVVIAGLLYLGVQMETGEGILVPEAAKERYRQDKIKVDLYHLEKEKSDLLVKEYGKFFLNLFSTKDKIIEEDFIKAFNNAYPLNVEPTEELIEELIFNAHLIEKNGKYFTLGEAMLKVTNRFPNLHIFIKNLSIRENKAKNHVLGSEIKFYGVNIEDLFGWKLKDKIHLSEINFGVLRKDAFTYPRGEVEIKLKNLLTHEYNIYMYITIIYSNKENSPTVSYFCPTTSIFNDIRIEEYEKHYFNFIKAIEKEVPQDILLKRYSS